MIADLLTMYLAWIAAVAIWVWFGSAAWRAVASTVRAGHELRSEDAARREMAPALR
jgi:hypothetical protein